jgi:hypothetical protein
MNEEVAYDRATISNNGKFMLVDTWSGYYGSSLDPKGKHIVLAAGASDDLIGAALLDSLSSSRVGTHEDHPDLYVSREQYDQEYMDWVQAVMQRCGYKTKRALFKNMKSCTVHRRRGCTIKILPSVHDSLEGWTPLSEDQNVIVPAESSPADIGVAVRLGLARCIA